MVFRRAQERGRGRAERADGRAFDPADVDDGMPRVIVTVDTTSTHADGSNPVHIDYFNMPGADEAAQQDQVDQLMTLAHKTWLRAQTLGSVARGAPTRSKGAKR